MEEINCKRTLYVPKEDLMVEDPDTYYPSNGIKLLSRKKDMNPSIMKFWIRRHLLFSRMDRGIWLTEELWYSVTPEEIALYICKFFKHCLPEASKVLDLFSGGGGNSTHFSKYFEKVYCVDYNLVNLQCSYHNAGIYGKRRQDKLVMFQADWKFADDDSGNCSDPSYTHTQEVIQHLQNESIDIVFSSPPWGGVEYMGKNGESFDLDKLSPLPLDKLLQSMLKISPNIAIFLPKNCDINQIQEITERVYKKKTQVRVSNMYLKGFLKGIIVFWGDAFTAYKRPTSEDMIMTNSEYIGYEQ